MKFKKIIGLLLAAMLTLSVFASCGGKQSETVLSAPANVSVDTEGTVTWDAVENAVMYYVFYGDKDTFVTETSFTLPDKNSKCNVSVQAVVKTAGGNVYTAKSEEITYEPYVEPFDPSTVKIAIACDTTEIKSGATSGKGSATFTATVTGVENGASTDVNWKIVSGSEFIESSSANGNKFTVVAAKNVSGDNDVIVEATSVGYSSVSARKSIAVVSKPVLTQAMLNEAASADKIGFEGYVQIDVYERKGSQKGKLSASQTMNIKTSMSGDKDSDSKTRNTWSAEYYDGSLGIQQTIYCRKDSAGNACEIGVSLMNEEQLYPVKDDTGNVISWEDSGFYNNFAGLSVSDFYLDEDTWRYTYDTKKLGFDKVKKMIASANPYDFDPKNLELIIDGGEIIGISAVANDSYSIVDGYISVQTLRTVFNVGENVKVTTIGKFTTLDEYKNDPSENSQELYKRLSVLQEAIGNMQSLKSYKLEYSNDQITNLGASFTSRTGFDETVTENYSYFKPCDITTVNNENVRTYDEYGTYGYKKVKNSNGTYRTDIYNAFYDGREDGDRSDLYFNATRAFTDGFESSKASFAFSPEIFTTTGYSTDNDGNETYTFMVDETMCQVATTLYKGIGNDVSMYGIFAKVAADTSGNRIAPYIIVKKVDGKWYFDYAAFYYDLGLMTGAIQLQFSDYDSATLESSIVTKIEATKTRELPANWNEVYITVPASGSTPETNVPAGDFMFGGGSQKAYFGNTLFAISGAEIPFFGDKDCLGDTFAVGMASYFNVTDESTGSTVQQNAILLYYDVPLDIDYTITTSLDTIRKYLTDKGFAASGNGTFRKGNLCIRPFDSSLDFMIYIWTEETLSAPKNVKVSADGVVTWDRVENATSYVVYVDGIRASTVTSARYSLPVSYKDGKSHQITVVASASGYVSSAKSETVTFKSGS